jgi:hypothetical protein
MTFAPWAMTELNCCVEEHAAFVRDLFRRYLEIGSVVRLKALLDQEDARLPLRTDGTGKAIGGGLISRGHLYKILSNPIYLGRLTHRGQVYEGLHDLIINQETWDRVQALLTEHTQRTSGARQQSDGGFGLRGRPFGLPLCPLLKRVAAGTRKRALRHSPFADTCRASWPVIVSQRSIATST